MRRPHQGRRGSLDQTHRRARCSQPTLRTRPGAEGVRLRRDPGGAGEGNLRADRPGLWQCRRRGHCRRHRRQRRSGKLRTPALAQDAQRQPRRDLSVCPRGREAYARESAPRLDHPDRIHVRTDLCAAAEASGV